MGSLAYLLCKIIGSNNEHFSDRKVKDECVVAFRELSKALCVKCTIEPSKKAKSAKIHIAKSGIEGRFKI
ncbi:hypothetical protein [Helicobacter sp. T3_23-1056]